MLKIINDPFDMVLQAFHGLYPDLKAEIMFDPNLRGEEYKECGYTQFDDTEIPFIGISTNILFIAMIEVLAHELAHVAAGEMHDHDKVWEDTFNKIHKGYDKIAKSLCTKKGDIDD